MISKTVHVHMGNLAKKHGVQVVLLFLALGFLVVAWETKNFALLLIALSLLSVFILSINRKILPVGVFLAATLFSLAAGEFLIATISSIKAHDDYPKAHYDLYSRYRSGGYFDKKTKFGYKAKEGVFDSKKYAPDNTIIYDVVYTIGEDGFRKTLGDQSAKINVFGGSFAFGEGLNDYETLSYFLKSEYGLSSKNWGMHGYGMNQVLYLLENEPSTQGKDFNILLTAPWHALRSSCKESHTYTTPRFEISSGALQYVGPCGADTSLGPFRIVKMIIGKSEIWGLLRKIFNRSNTITAGDIELYIEILREIQRVSEEAGAKVIVAFIKTTETNLSKSGYTNENIINKISKFADILVDVTLADSREALDQKYYLHELDTHPTAVANKERARLIASYLQN